MFIFLITNIFGIWSFTKEMVKAAGFDPTIFQLWVRFSQLYSNIQNHIKFKLYFNLNSARWPLYCKIVGIKVIINLKVALAAIFKMTESANSNLMLVSRNF